jgi:WXG100 family type VII secretion target
MSVPVVVDYDGLEQVSRQFVDIGTEVAQVSKKIAVQTQDLHDNGWTGRGSDSFYAEMSGEVLPALERLVQALVEATRVVEQMARIYRAAEEEARSGFGGPR